jgi:hypothetical protein
VVEEVVVPIMVLPLEELVVVQVVLMREQVTEHKEELHQQLQGFKILVLVVEVELVQQVHRLVLMVPLVVPVLSSLLILHKYLKNSDVL